MKGCILWSFGMAIWDILKGAPYLLWEIIKAFIELVVVATISAAVASAYYFLLVYGRGTPAAITILTGMLLGLFVFLALVIITGIAHGFRLWAKEMGLSCTTESYGKYMEFKREHKVLSTHSWSFRAHKWELNKEVKESMEKKKVI